MFYNFFLHVSVAYIGTVKYQVTCLYVYVCSAHFKEDDYFKLGLCSKSSQEVLKANVIPSMFDHVNQEKLAKIFPYPTIICSSRRTGARFFTALHQVLGFVAKLFKASDIAHIFYRKSTITQG